MGVSPRCSSEGLVDEQLLNMAEAMERSIWNLVSQNHSWVDLSGIVHLGVPEVEKKYINLVNW